MIASLKPKAYIQRISDVPIVVAINISWITIKLSSYGNASHNMN